MFFAAARILDVLAVLLSGWVAYRIRWDTWTVVPDAGLAILLAGTLTVILFPLAGAYRSSEGLPRISEIGRALAAWLAVAGVLVLLGAATKTTADFSRLWMGYWTLLASLMLVVARTGLVLWSSSRITRGSNRRRVGIVGTGELARNAADAVKNAPWTGLEVAGFISVGDDDSTPAIALLGKIDETEEILHRESLKEIWIALPLSAETSVHEAVNRLQNCMATVRYVPDLFAFRLLNHVPTRVGKLITIELNSSPLHGANLVLKTVFDWIFALTVLTVVSPLLIIVAILVKITSPGPVLFKQVRHGWDGKPIKIYKFRTMHVPANRNTRFVQAKKNDPRVTAIGRFLRRTSIDELPQFINVLQGRLSVVGPRPHPVELNEEFKGEISAYMQRHRVKPGITGWAQVNGFRGETDTLEKMQKRIEYDLYYIDNWSISIDIKIIILTIFGRYTHVNAC